MTNLILAGHSAYPNPAKEKATINFTIVEDEQIATSVYDSFVRLAVSGSVETLGK